MIIESEKIKLQILVYDSNDKLIKIYVPEEINEMFHLPLGSSKVKIEEYEIINQKKIIKSSSTIYLGVELRLKEILSLHEKIIIDFDLGVGKEKIEKILQKRLLFDYKNDSIKILKILKENENAIDSIFGIEYYLKTLTEELKKINKEKAKSKKLIK